MRVERLIGERLGCQPFEWQWNVALLLVIVVPLNRPGQAEVADFHDVIFAEENVPGGQVTVKHLKWEIENNSCKRKVGNGQTQTGKWANAPFSRTNIAFRKPLDMTSSPNRRLKSKYSRMRLRVHGNG